MAIPEEKQAYAETIRQLIPVNELPAEVQNEIIKNADLIELNKKDQIFNQGDRDGYSFYLIEGEIDLVANAQVSSSIKASTDRAKYPMAQLQPRRFTGVAKVNSIVMRIDRNSLDKLLVVHQGQGESADAFGDGLGDNSSTLEVDIIDGDEDESVDWMTRMLQSEIFASMPSANMHQLFVLLEPIEYKKGDNIITQGETGEHYYIIQEGKCDVLRQIKPGAKELKLAQLSAGDGFGEEALITETVRNATIRMNTDGLVAQLSKDNFVSLIKNPTLKAVSTEKAEEIINQGGKWLDVRFKNEHDRSHIDDSIHVPLNILRMQADKLDANLQYVVYCDTGGRSSAGAFLLIDRGINAFYLDGGLVNHPEIAPDDEVTQIPKPPPPPVKPETQKKSVVSEKPVANDKTETSSAEPVKQDVKAQVPVQDSDDKDEEMDPEIMATVIETELTRNDMEIERAKNSDQTVIRNQETAKKLEEDRERLKAEKLKVESEVQKMRQQEEERLKKLQQEAEIRMQQERKNIEDVYAKNAEEMEKLEQLKADAEAKLKVDRERLEKEAEEASKNKQDTEKLKKELEAAKKAMEEAAVKQQQDQEEMRKKIELEARKMLEIERRKLAEQVAKNNIEIETARKEKAIAEAARTAAKEEAELMVKEMQTKQDQSRDEQEQRIKEERIKLEEEQKKIQIAMQEIHKAKAEAEAMKRAALAEVTALKVKQAQEDVTASEAIKDQMQTKIKSAQEKLAMAAESAAKEEKEEEKVVVAQKVNEEDLVKKKAEEEELRKKLQADLAGFKEELDEAEREYANSTTTLEHMKRIKERAMSAKAAAENANDNLLSDISSQLTDKK
jgi:CRP-like cAMP-binding protein